MNNYKEALLEKKYTDKLLKITRVAVTTLSFM